MKVAHQFLLAPTQTGAISAASPKLADYMVKAVPFERCNTVVEFGPGTGVVTEAISQALATNTTFFALELNRSFAEKTRNRCPGVTVYQDNATRLPKYLREHGISQCDAIVSSLPWTLFDHSLQEALLDVIASSLAPGGTFVTYAYLGVSLHPAGRRFRRLVNERFLRPDKQIIWNNVPPAHVFSCQKSG